MTRTARFLTCATLSTVTAFCEDATFAPPVITYLFNQGTARFQTVAGVLGASRVIDGPAVDAAFTMAWTSPTGTFALAANDAGIGVVRGLAGAPELSPVPDTDGAVKLLMFNRSGSAAAFYSEQCACVRLLTGLPDAPRVVRTLDATVVAGLAVSDDGNSVAIATGERLDISLPDRVTSIPGLRASSIAYAKDGRMAALSDDGSVWIVRDPAGSAESEAIAGANDGLEHPVAVAFDDQSRLLVADAAGVMTFDLSAAIRERAGCECRPKLLERAAGGTVFRISEQGDSPLWLFKPESRHIFFVPLDTGEAK